MADRNRMGWLGVAGLLLGSAFLGCGGGSSSKVVATPSPSLHGPRFNGSFVQSGIMTGFNDGKWRTEFKCMKAAGVDELFVQWTMDSKGMKALYPSTLSGVTMTADALGPCLSAAKVAGVDVYLGLQSNDDWWTNYAWDGEWLDQEAAISNRLADDLFRQYGGSPAFKGWYIWFEVDNVNEPSSAEWDNLARYFKTVCDHLHALAPGRKVVIAPFFATSPDAGGMAADGWQAMWEYILARAPIDVIALQDGVGAGNAVAADLPLWFGATKNAVATRNGSQLWADTENFRIADNSPMSLGEVVADMKAVEPFVSRYLSFSFNHYTSPQSVNPFFYATYLDYVQKGAVDSVPPGLPKNLAGAAADSTTIHLAWTAPTDNIGIVGYTLYRDGVARRVNSMAPALDDFSLEPATTYSYQLAAFDAAGNESPLTGPISVATPVDPVYPTNLAAGKTYAIEPPPGDAYPDDGVKLTDGVSGTADWSGDSAWVGSLQASYSITLDLGSVQSINEVNSTWLQDQAAYIFFPARVAYSVSENGADFTPVGTVSQPSSPVFNKKCKITNLSAQGRYVRIDVASNGWSFVDEVEVRRQ